MDKQLELLKNRITFNRTYSDVYPQKRHDMRFLTWMGCFLMAFITTAQNTPLSIIPQPQRVTQNPGAFLLSKRVKIVLPPEAKTSLDAAQWLQQRLRLSSGILLEITSVATSPSIHLIVDPTMSSEEYALDVAPEGIKITSATGKGHFYGIQTLLQVMPPTVFSGSGNQGIWTIPSVSIQDAPRFAYRGMMLDVGRHFYSVDMVKRFIDLLALHKFNTFHWHLTEDQGWRIEIKKYPKLTEVGSIRKETMKGHYRDQQWDGTPYGGFYTQEQIRDIVAYAQSRYITIIPEIEMPGHALAALAAYPEYGCTGGPYQVGTTWGVEENVFCPYEKTFTFLEDVLTEVMDLFPSPYIHIGGDECPKTTWKNSAFCQDLIKKENLKDEHGLQSYFIKRIDAFLSSKGRKLIGWDEILEGGISPNATIMSWRGVEGGIAAVQQGHQAIMTPTSHVYFDYYQGDPTTEPLAIGGYLPVEKVYGYDPVPAGLTPDESKRILGTQGNVWTEYIATPGYLDYMVFPRASALAEVAWTLPENKSYPDFIRRLATHFERLENVGVRASRRVYDIQAKTKKEQEQVIVELKTSDPQLKIQVKANDSWVNYPESGYPVTESRLLEARVVNSKGEPVGVSFQRFFHLHLATGIPYVLEKAPKVYTGGEEFALTNGVTGTLQNTATWIGWNGEDAVMTFDLGQSIDISQVQVSYQQAWASWILAPRRVQVEVSTDGKYFRTLAGQNILPTDRQDYFVEEVNLTFPKTRTRYIRFKAEHAGKLPPNHPAAGQPSWLFLDEVKVK